MSKRFIHTSVYNPFFRRSGSEGETTRCLLPRGKPCPIYFLSVLFSCAYVFESCLFPRLPMLDSYMCLHVICLCSLSFLFISAVFLPWIKIQPLTSKEFKFLGGDQHKTRILNCIIRELKTGSCRDQILTNQCKN